MSCLINKCNAQSVPQYICIDARYSTVNYRKKLRWFLDYCWSTLIVWRLLKFKNSTILKIIKRANAEQERLKKQLQKLQSLIQYWQETRIYVLCCEIYWKLTVPYFTRTEMMTTNYHAVGHRAEVSSGGILPVKKSTDLKWYIQIEFSANDIQKNDIQKMIQKTLRDARDLVCSILFHSCISFCPFRWKWENQTSHSTQHKKQGMKQNINLKQTHLDISFRTTIIHKDTE